MLKNVKCFDLTTISMDRGQNPITKQDCTSMV